MKKITFYLQRNLFERGIIICHLLRKTGHSPSLNIYKILNSLEPGKSASASN